MIKWIQEMLKQEERRALNILWIRTRPFHLVLQVRQPITTVRESQKEISGEPKQAQKMPSCGATLKELSPESDTLFMI